MSPFMELNHDLSIASKVSLKIDGAKQRSMGGLRRYFIFLGFCFHRLPFDAGMISKNIPREHGMNYPNKILPCGHYPSYYIFQYFNDTRSP